MAERDFNPAPPFHRSDPQLWRLPLPYRFRPLLLSVVCLLSICAVGLSQAPRRVPAGSSASDAIPHLERRGNATQLIVDGKGFLVLGGEVHNSSSSSVEYMRKVWPQLAAMHLNTVLVPVAWETTEPEEG